MTMSKFTYAINSNTLKKQMSSADIVKLAVAVGADGIEWGLSGLETAQAEAKEMQRLTADAGLKIAGFLNAGQLWKTDLMRQWSEAVAAGGGKSLRVAHPWFAYNYDESLHQRESFLDLVKKARDGLVKLVPLGREYGIRYVLEMHGGSVAASAPIARQLMEGLDPTCVGIIFDPANTVIEGFIRPRGSVEILGEYLAYIHAKNLGFRPTGYQSPDTPARYLWERYYTRLENGMVDYVEIMFALKVGGFSGWICLEEYFAGRPDIQKEIFEGIAFLKECAAAAPDAPREPFTTFND
jgi:sugar phosphate isomerase/epimerase